MKAKGIEIYTIGFNVGNSSTAAYKLLSQCAATDIPDSKFYAPVTNDQLSAGLPRHRVEVVRSLSVEVDQRGGV